MQDSGYFPRLGDFVDSARESMTGGNAVTKAAIAVLYGLVMTLVAVVSYYFETASSTITYF